MIFQTQTQTKNTYEEVFRLFEESAEKPDRHKNDRDYSHIFLAVNNYDKDELPYYNVSTMNNNFPELVEQLIWEHLVDISEDELTEDEARAHYNWMMYKIAELATKRLERGYMNSEGCKEA